MKSLFFCWKARLRDQLRAVRAVPLKSRASWAVKTAVVAGAFAVAGWAFSQRFELRFDPQVMSCIDAEWLLIDTKDRTPEIGGLFAYRAFHAEPVYADGTAMGKYLVAGPGDRIEITDDFRVLVNGVEKAKGMPHLSDMPADEVRRRFCGSRLLQRDEYWMMGTSFRSFDSRYWGPIHASQIIGRAYIIF